MKQNNFNVMHVTEIDNDLSKGTSTIIPQYIISQKKVMDNVALLNCNNIKLEKLSKVNNIYKLDDNVNMDAVKNFKPSLLVFHEVYKPYYLKLYKYCLKNNIPYIIIPHGCLTIDAQNHKRIKKILGNTIFFNDFLKHAKYIQYLSKNEYDKTKFSKLNYYILGNGVDSIPQNNVYKETERNIQKGLNLIYVGRYDYLIKGLDKLILACLLIKGEMVRRNIKVNLFGIGDENSENIIKKNIKKYNLENIVLFNGPIYNLEKRKKILENDVFIQVSRTEGQPLGIMEAMSLGMPLLISDGTGFEKIVKDNQCGVTTKCDEKMISEAILNIYELKEKLEKFSDCSYQYAKKNFSWSYIAELSIKKYSQIIRGE